MIEIARNLSKEQKLEGNYQVDSVTELKNLKSDYFDIVVSNYVLQDTPDLDSVMKSLYRVIKNIGRLILVFTHPCFPQSDFTKLREDNTVQYK
ncbi:MAG: Ubiquinone/menaquinone biosynthesis C-methyltransferase UbiE [Candidatus Heimdallarchaeota archaeon LC_3]|nr:MAG: Ubiquinone/menaquinone biosynthesis C-methyltransferase UbiE [Candidatus Heimdallarchaeota archaeon LC_3]